MARRPGRTQEQWEAVGRAAILDLLTDREVAPWAEIEARIGSGWKTFPNVQPLQLGGARRALRAEGVIEEDISRHTPEVRTLRLPIEEGRKRHIERVRGRKRKLYRKYLSWAGDHDLCGKHGEHVVLDTFKTSASDAGLYIPPQAVGELREVEGIRIEKGPLDLLAHVLDLEVSPIRAEVPILVEVKNIARWIYPEARELWELLVKAAQVSSELSVVPVLVCMRAAYPTFQMAKDIGFLGAELRSQILSPNVPEADFLTIINEFGLNLQRSRDPVPSLQTFLTKTLRRSPPPTPPHNTEIPWYRQQAERFSAVAPIVLSHKVLAESTDVQTRRGAFSSFRSQVVKVVDWELVRGW